MHHGNDDVARAGHQVHRAAHAFHHFAGDLPVSDIAAVTHFHGAQYRQVDLSGADHTEAFRAVEKSPARQHRHGLLACIDQVCVYLCFHGVWSHAQHAVLTLHHDEHAFRDIVGYKGGNADAEVHVHAVPEFLCNSSRDTVFIECHGFA